MKTEYYFIIGGIVITMSCFIRFKQNKSFKKKALITKKNDAITVVNPIIGFYKSNEKRLNDISHKMSNMINTHVYNNSSLMQCVTNSIMMGFIVELTNLIGNTDNKSYLAQAKQQFQNYAKLFQKQSSIRSIDNISDKALLDKTNVDMIKITINTSKFAGILISSEQIRRYFTNNTHKFSFMDIMSMMSEYSGSLKDLVEKINKEIEHLYYEDPETYRLDYENTIQLISIFQKIDNELYSSMDKLSKFNKIFTNNIIKAINNIIQDKCESNRYDSYFRQCFIDINKYLNPVQVHMIKAKD